MWLPSWFPHCCGKPVQSSVARVFCCYCGKATKHYGCSLEVMEDPVQIGLKQISQNKNFSHAISEQEYKALLKPISYREHYFCPCSLCLHKCGHSHTWWLKHTHTHTAVSGVCRLLWCCAGFNQDNQWLLLVCATLITFNYSPGTFCEVNMLSLYHQWSTFVLHYDGLHDYICNKCKFYAVKTNIYRNIVIQYSDFI